MTVTREIVEAVSSFIVSADGDFNGTKYEIYKGWAEDELKIDDPGLSEAKYDEAWANLICDIFTSSRGLRDMKSEKIGDYSYTRMGTGKSSFRLRYEEIIKQAAQTAPTEGVSRADVNLPSEFLFDKQPIRRFGDE